MLRSLANMRSSRRRIYSFAICSHAKVCGRRTLYFDCLWDGGEDYWEINVKKHIVSYEKM